MKFVMINKTDGSDPTRREGYWGKVLKTVAPYGLNTLNWWLLLHAFIFFRDSSLVNVKCILLSLTCVFCKEFYFCILRRSIILFGGDSYRVETNKLIYSAGSLLGFYAMWDFSRGNFWTSCNIQWITFFSLSELFNCM